MSILIGASLDLKKINKSKIKDGRYLDVTIAIHDQLNDYQQNVSVFESVSKQEKETPGFKKTYIGNGRIVWRDDGVEVQRPAPREPAMPDASDMPQTSSQPGDDLPF